MVRKPCTSCTCYKASKILSLLLYSIQNVNKVHCFLKLRYQISIQPSQVFDKWKFR